MINVEIWSDVMCPFCYIGKRRLEKAIEHLNLQNNVLIHWKSFELNPYSKTDPSKNIHQYLAENKGISLDEAKEMSNYVTQIAKDEGILFNMDAAIPANSHRAHQLLHYAKKIQPTIQNELKEQLFHAYFVEGKNTDDLAVLEELALRVELTQTDFQEFLSNNNLSAEVHADQREAQELNVRGVPFFVFNRKYAISGAQPLDHFIQNLKVMAHEFSYLE